MKYIITEDQYDRIFDRYSLTWVKRRYELVKDSLKETFELMKSSICRIDDYERFEKEFVHVMMEGLHPYFYYDEVFNYNDTFEVLSDLFYVECTEFYFKGRERC